MKKTIGIIGGMGPMATVDLFKKIVELDPAASDQEYIRICVDSNTNIPDRTEAILHHGKNPVPEIVNSGILLEGMGANVLVMSCNTAHYFYDEIVQYLHVPLLNMLQETALEAARCKMKKVALLATDGTIQSGVYEREFVMAGVEIVEPSPDGQKLVMDAIYNGVKAGKHPTISKALSGELRSLFIQGAEALILGCTELPILFADSACDLPYIDPTSVLAQAAIDFLTRD